MSPALHPEHAAARRRLVAGAVLALLLVGLAGSQAALGAPVTLVHNVLEYLRQTGGAGTFLFAVLQILVALSGAAPASLMGVAAGAVYGVGPGFVLAAAGSLVGAVIAFALSRSLFRSAIVRLLLRNGRLRRIDASVSQRGWRLVLLLRLSPVMPFSATSYLLGLSSISLTDYLVGTLACLPALFGFVLVGALTNVGLAAWSSGESPLRLALLATGGIATLLLLASLAHLVRQRGADVAPLVQEVPRP